MKKKDEFGNIGGGIAPKKMTTHEYNSKGGNNQTSSNYSSHNQRIKNQQ